MNVEEIFFRLKKYNKITRNELYELGVDDDYIEFVLEKKILVQIDENTYTIGNAKSLLYYGRGLMEEEDYKSANNVFDCAYNADMTDFEVNYQLFYRELKHLKIKRSHVFKFFNIVYNGLVNSGREYDANYYVFLLGNLYGSSDKGNKNELNPFDKYRNVFINLDEEDILLPDGDKESNDENMMRKSVFNNSYHNVTTMLNKLFTNKNRLYFEDMVEKELLLKWLIRKRDVNRVLISCLKNEKIEAIQSLLNREDERRNLTMANSYLLKLVNLYLTIKESGNVPTPKYFGDDIFAAIDGNNFELALKLENKRLIDYNIERESTIYMMLVLINKLIKSDVKVEDNSVNKIEIEEEKNIEPITLSNSEMQALDAKVGKLRDGRMIYLLDPMPQEKRDLVREYIKYNYGEDIFTFSIGIEPERRVVLRYKPIVKEHVNIKDVLDDAKAFYASEDYNFSIDCYELALKIGKPFASSYGGYGMALYKVGRRKEALDCLKVATIISKTESNGKIDFTDIIERIENPPERENRKPRVVVNESEFEDKQESGLSDELINDIIGLTKEGDISLVDACKKLRLGEDAINYIMLLYARDCYYLGNNNEGDKYLKRVEKCKKSLEVKELYKEILVNKKYYHNRYDENGNQLVFIKK